MNNNLFGESMQSKEMKSEDPGIRRADEGKTPEEIFQEY